jgi:aminoglycoside phosphotransferase (APT) family kinase protein
MTGGQDRSEQERSEHEEPTHDTATAQPDPQFRRVVADLLASTPDALTFASLVGGVSSDIWRVDAAGVSYCAKRALPRLRVRARWEAPVSRNTEEVRWLRTVRPWIGEQAAEVVAHDEAAGVAVLRWYDPATWRNWKTELLGGRVDARVAAALGRTLGTIAREASRHPELADAFDNRLLFDALRIDPFFRYIRTRHPRMADLIEQLETDRSTLVHGDFSPKNVLTSEGAEIRILDAETATWGSAGFDPGYLLAHLLLKYEHRRDRALLDAAARFWGAYRTETGTVFADIDRLTVRTLVGMLLARIDGKSPVEYLANTERDALRDCAAGLLDSTAAVPVATLLSNWARLRGDADG